MKIRFYLFAAKWFWKNRYWHTTRQKYKAFDKAWAAECRRIKEKSC